MPNSNLATYLTDHLAGATAGLEILDHLIEHHSSEAARETLTTLKGEIESDRTELKTLMDRLEIEESTFRKAAAWLTEKGAEIKLRFDDPSAGPLLVFESLEALSLGIEGKHSLWKALSTVAEHDPSLRVADYDRLGQSAEDQRTRIEELRIQMAISAFTSKK